MTTMPAVGFANHPAWILMHAIENGNADLTGRLLNEAEDPKRLAFDLATLAAAMHGAPCKHCGNPSLHFR